MIDGGAYLVLKSMYDIEEEEIKKYDEFYSIKKYATA